MAGGQTYLIQKLQKALTSKGELVTINITEFWSMDKHKYVKRYHIKKQVQDPDNDNKSTMVELFNSCSQIQITFFLRDYLYSITGQEIPHDNPIWEEAKEKWLKEHS